MYTIQHQDTSFRFEDVAEASVKAQEWTNEESVELQVIHQATGAVVLVTTPIQPGHYFQPWQRIENPKFSAPYFEGFIPAYTRKRIQATVYRSQDHAGWRVHDGRTGNFVDVKTTKEACHLTTSMRKGQEL
jgi:hypothetical protein